MHARFRPENTSLRVTALICVSFLVLLLPAAFVPLPVCLAMSLVMVGACVAQSRQARPGLTAPRALLTVLVLSALWPSQAAAVLNEFSLADGYQSPFSTRVWTYNSLWQFDGGAINNNYVAQHGYNSGFALNEPFALVVRNDNSAGSYQFSYDFVPADLAGLNPAAVNANTLTLTFDVCSTVAQNSGTANNAAMMTMAFGGTRSAPGLTLGFSDSNRLMWSDAGGNLHEFGGYTLNGSGWDRVTLTMDFSADTYDLSVAQMSGDGINASNTYTPINTFNVVSGMSFTNPLSSMNHLFFDTFTDPEDGGGWHKMFLDNFDSRLTAVPEPATGWLALMGLATVLAVRLGRSRRRAGPS